jgi:23S rRNA (guanosine2251-2'-O)-methyltransferase
MKSELLWGFHPVIEALRAGRRHFADLYVSQQRGDQRLAELVREAETRRIPVQTLTPRALTEMAGAHHQGVAARVSPLAAENLDRLCQDLAAGRCEPWILILDGIVDPQNLGALVRTAVCAGMGAIVVPRDRSARPGPTVSRASAGALEHARLVTATNLAAALTRLKEAGLWICGLDREQGRSLFASDLAGPLGIVVGAEGKGIRPLVRRHCDFLAAVPQSGPIDSLNASAAGAVAIYESWRQRRCPAAAPPGPPSPLLEKAGSP